MKKLIFLSILMAFQAVLADIDFSQNFAAGKIVTKKVCGPNGECKNHSPEDWIDICYIKVKQLRGNDNYKAMIYIPNFEEVDFVKKDRMSFKPRFNANRREVIADFANGVFLRRWFSRDNHIDVVYKRLRDRSWELSSYNVYLDVKDYKVQYKCEISFRK